MTRTLTIDPRYDGFAGVAFGGYVGGIVAEPLGGSASVRFRRPTPTGRPIELDVREGHATLTLDGETLVDAHPWEDALDVPQPPTLAEADIASARYPGRNRHAQPRCFGCGPDRDPTDGLRLAPGPVADRPLVAAPWTPAPWCGQGHVDVPFVWAALDCPSAWAHLVHAPLPGQQVTATMAVRLHAPVRVGAPHVVFAWVVAAEAGARVDGAAVADANGRIVAVGRSRWVGLHRAPRPRDDTRRTDRRNEITKESL